MTAKTIVSAKAFSGALDQVSKVLKRSLFPQLSEILVRCSGDRCTLTATDLNTWLTKEIPASGDEFAFVFHRTKDVVKACHFFDGELSLELSSTGSGENRGATLLISSGDRSGEFETMDAEGFPETPCLDEGTSFALDPAALAERVSHVSYAAARQSDKVRPGLASIQCTGHHVMALDGMQLACDTDEATSFPKAFMTYSEALSYLGLFEDQTVMVRLGERRGQFKGEMLTIDFPLTGSDFYRVETAIPQSFSEEFQVSPKDFLRELKYLEKFVAKAPRPYVRFRGGELFMPLSNGKYRAAVRLTGTNEITFAFDLFKMIRAIGQFKDAPEARIKVSSPLAPIVIEADGRRDFALLCTVKLSEKLMAA